MGSNEETNAAGTDTRPPMLVESDYDSWKIRIHRSPHNTSSTFLIKQARAKEDVGFWNLLMQDQDKDAIMEAKKNGATLDAEAEAFLADVGIEILIIETSSDSQEMQTEDTLRTFDAGKNCKNINDFRNDQYLLDKEANVFQLRYLP
ncbi:hypothetical protein Tco_1217901 [Tanacetum coccineum]